MPIFVYICSRNMKYWRMPVVRKAWEDFILHLMMTSHELTTILLNLHGLEVQR